MQFRNPRAQGRTVRQDAHRATSGAFLFLLLSGFAMLAMLVVAVGAQVYRTVARTAEDNYNARMALSYVAGKVRCCDALGGVDVVTQDGQTILRLNETVDGRDYCTYLYWRGGNLCEYFGAHERAFNPALGESLVPALAFEAELLQSGLLHIHVTDPEGHAHALALYLNAAGGVAP